MWFREEGKGRRGCAGAFGRSGQWSVNSVQRDEGLGPREEASGADKIENLKLKVKIKNGYRK